MTFKIATKTFQLPKAESQIGVIAQVIDLGLQKNNFFGSKDAEGKEDNREFIPQVSITFELPDDVLESGEQKGLPLLASKDFTKSMHKRAGLRKLINSANKKDLTDAEANDFDLTDLIGKGVFVQIEHYTNKKNGTSSKIGNIMRLDSRTVVPSLVVEPLVIAPDSPLSEVEKIKASWLKEKVLKGRVGKQQSNTEF